MTTEDPTYNEEAFIDENEAEVREATQEEHDVWYEASIIFQAFNEAADAVRDAAARAFSNGRDGVAYFLREQSYQLDKRAKSETDEWEKSRTPK